MAEPSNTGIAFPEPGKAIILGPDIFIDDTGYIC